MEFLTRFVVSVPENVPIEVVNDIRSRETERCRVLAELGYLQRLWVLPGEPRGWQGLGLWRAQNAADMQTIVESLPRCRWRAVETTPLARHPNDPPLIRSRLVHPDRRPR